MNWLILTLVLLQTAPAQPQSSPAARALARQAAALMGQNKIDAAIEKYTQAIKLSPKFADAYVKRGLARRTKGDLPGAIDDYETAISIDPQSVAGNRFVAQAYSNRGFIQLDNLNVDTAIADFTKAINIHSKEQREFYYRRGYARLIKEDLAPALDDLNTALTLEQKDNFSDCLIYAARGMVKVMQGKNLQGQMDFDECAKLDKSEQFELRSHLQSIEAQIMRARERRSNKPDTRPIELSQVQLTPSSIPITLSPAPARQSNTSQN